MVQKDMEMSLQGLYYITISQRQLQNNFTRGETRRADVNCSRGPSKGMIAARSPGNGEIGFGAITRRNE